ncbi:site-specific integrase [Halococcus dombrowskii]|uniref:Site-specific integrase n=1 Tax=Halococcus dombrowskii TaxID=179637 RepID=A0AAV3SB38_HALDO|nr:site-specific integrase [Halococcus dombrowskii]UOO94277.1 site-specific integrase [Halococcus dombrowskii]
MRLADNPDKGRKVWLTESEVDELLGVVEDTEKRIAFRLMAHCGLRTKEVLRVTPNDVRPMDGNQAGYKLRVWEGKGDKYRETWAPGDLVQVIQTYTDMANGGNGIEPDEPLIDTTRRTVQRWIKAARETLEAETGDEGWGYLSAHDLRRTWGTRAIESGVLPTVVMQAGGWDDFKTFQEHYMGQHSDSVVSREAAKVLG